MPVDDLAAALAPPDTRAPLRGVPYFLKDLFDLAGTKTRAGARFLSEVRPLPAQDAAIVQAFRRCGAACAGKTHLHEFAFGLTGENPHYGDCTHPRFPGRTTGGSSSGSAAAVAAGIVPLATGTDTGGSIRVPAAFNGIWGHKPTWGVVPTDGHFFPGTDSARAVLSVCGPLAGDPADLEAALDIVADHPLAQPAVAYFAHSYGVETPAAIATTRVDAAAFASVVAYGSVAGAQFHPERSGEAGRDLLRAFLNWQPA